ncbi:MAG: LPS export ABC transporter periplasmic protein LptC [Alphaproteobacteria bacterium]|nr:MAG: LPS export ABC transporter periplasmic protein LptC [Alphaproteobacteria bacterium]
MDDDERAIADHEARLERLARRESVDVANAVGYTRFVRVMRLMLPLAAVGIITILFIRTGVEDKLIVPMESDKPEIQMQNIAKNELLNPKFESMDKKNQPYRITADRAVQGEKNKDLIMLDRPIGVMTMKDGIQVRVHSDTGAYRQDTERFFLQGGVFMQHADGYTLSSEEAHIDLKQNFAWSDKDVQGQGPDLLISAKGVRADGNTGEIIFTGPATLVLESGVDGVGQ